MRISHFTCQMKPTFSNLSPRKTFPRVNNTMDFNGSKQFNVTTPNSPFLQQRSITQLSSYSSRFSSGNSKNSLKVNRGKVKLQQQQQQPKLNYFSSQSNSQDSSSNNNNDKKSNSPIYLNQNGVPEITVQDTKKLLDQSKKKEDYSSNEDGVVLVDVREDSELEICAINNSIHIPMNHFFDSNADLDDAVETIQEELEDKGTDELEQRKAQKKGRPLVVVCCHHGRRSAAVTQQLQKQGVLGVVNMAGGIHQWAEEIEPDMARY
eukprot:gb/GECH01000419.1/.p1 GENE.gb/GECH01000419.1/~~gb/GECH01000419.1/.p1  ORF type:complete len:264 (+),score=65.14 gb/GECH01000419.1/:1-792(+)